VLEPVLDHGAVEWVGTDHDRGDIIDEDAERSQSALHRRDFTQSKPPVVGPDPDEGAALGRFVAVRPADPDSFNALDLHLEFLIRPRWE
jgi:hypothetical protein